jgi:multicomponent Na+:H+ antiporter subunit D
MDGIGRRMPWTMAAFTLGALGMIGVPPLAGFISKWYLATGGLANGQPWIIAVLIASSLLNAVYFLPIIYRGWFQDPAESLPDTPAAGKLEIHWMMLLPPLITAALALLAGLLADAPFSPLEWARLIAAREYRP